MAWMEIVLSFLTAQICLVTIVIMALRKPKSGIEKTYVVLNALYLCWSFSTLVLSVFNLDTKADLFVSLKYISAFSIGPVWFVFYLYFSRSHLISKKLDIKKMILLFSPVIVLTITYLTKSLDSSMYFFDDNGKITYSNGLWICLIVQSSYHFAGLIIVMRNAFMRQTKELTILITAGFTISQCITVFYYISRLYYEFEFMDVFPSAALVTLITFIIASYRYQFMNILPMALSEIVNGLNEGIMIVDGKGKIASVNKITEIILGMKRNKLLERNASDISEIILENWKYSDESRKAVLAIGKCNGEEVKGIIEYNVDIQYEIHCQPLKHQNLLIGWVVSFYNIHEHKSLTDELNQKNMQLMEAYLKLVEHAKVVEELAASSERNKIAGQIHDSVGHCLSILVAMLEVMKMTFRTQPVVVEDKLNNAHTIAKNGLFELRHMVSDFYTPKRSLDQLKESIQSMVEGFKETGIKVDVTFQGNPPYELDEKFWTAMYNTCKEALTNSLKHGKASNVIIIIRFDDKIELYILDDGNGCETIVKNVGLTLMEKRVHELNGSISFGSGGEKGFSIHIEIPVKAELS